MKNKIIIIATLFALFCLPYQAIGQQKLEIENPVFTFDSVPDGLHVTHEFILKNTGDTLLKIEKVSPP